MTPIQIPFDTEGVKRILPRRKNSVKPLKFEKQEICEKYRGKLPLFLKVHCDPEVDFCHFQMCGTDKKLCRVLDSLRSLENKNLCVSFVAV